MKNFFLRYAAVATLAGSMILGTPIVALADSATNPAEGSSQSQQCYELTLTSGTATNFVGLTTTDPLGASTPGLFTLGTAAPAVVTGPDGFSGAWDLVGGDSRLTGASWVNNISVAPGNLSLQAGDGQDGTVDVWRLFSQPFTLPANATINSAVLHFSADNSVNAFLDNAPIGSSPSYTIITDVNPTITAGAHAFEFVTKNDAYTGVTNPTAVIYKGVIDYCVPTPPGTLATTLSSGNAGSVVTGTAVHDSSVLRGVLPGATGTVTYTVFTDSSCLVPAGVQPATNQVAVAGDGTVPDSGDATLPVGTYYWQAVYSGDANNASVSSPCGSEVLTVTEPAPQTGSISGYKWKDIPQKKSCEQDTTVTIDNKGNKFFGFTEHHSGHHYKNKKDCDGDSGTLAPAPNGVHDVGEPLLDGWTIFIDLNGNKALDVGEVSDVTSGGGNYSFADLPAGTYSVCEVMQSGWQQTYPGTGAGDCHSVTLAAGQNVVDKDFGNAVVKDCKLGNGHGGFGDKDNDKNHDKDNGKVGDGHGGNVAHWPHFSFNFGKK